MEARLELPEGATFEVVTVAFVNDEAPQIVMAGNTQGNTQTKTGELTAFGTLMFHQFMKALFYGGMELSEEASGEAQ